MLARISHRIFSPLSSVDRFSEQRKWVIIEKIYFHTPFLLFLCLPAYLTACLPASPPSFLPACLPATTLSSHSLSYPSHPVPCFSPHFLSCSSHLILFLVFLSGSLWQYGAQGYYVWWRGSLCQEFTRHQISGKQILHRIYFMLAYLTHCFNCCILLCCHKHNTNYASMSIIRFILTWAW